ncbi:Ectopic P granules protein 5 [Choanephora cucurbitarum]|uniref:Ectopic P granules protein 5 n=1 Tax=Choanephora cucurbitarum TaxID=101091 RepID=A0A1C7N3A1_9FUNG|nr:Ectopic P granules protein 5 [Choanephora cucurbitarum]
MDKELESLITKYKQSLDQLSEINHKAQEVNDSEQAIVHHLSKKHEAEEKLNQIISKLRLDVDHLLSKRQSETNAAKLAVDTYLHTIVWNLFSRTELQNEKLLFNQDQNRLSDKKCLLKLITTLFQFDQHHENTEYITQLHLWMTGLITIYLRLCSSNEKKKILQLLKGTSHISPWAIPLIQFHASDITDAENYIEILDIIFFNQETDETPTWTEDDFLAVMDQLAIDFHYSKMMESIGPDEPPHLLFEFSRTMTDSLLKAIKRFGSMKSLTKRLSQTVIQLALLLVEGTEERGWDCQEQIDQFLCSLVYSFYDLKKDGWFFLPNIPYKVLSMEALWQVTTHLLQMEDRTVPISLDLVLNEHLPNITRFQYELHDNQNQGVFMLSCLTNIVTCIPPGVDEISSMRDPEGMLSACIIAVIAYTLFNVAFIDKLLRELFYRDVRDNLRPICRCHPFIISLLFRWTVQHMATMERMALYLFHSIHLEDWVILKDDLTLLHKLLTVPSSCPSLTTQQLAQIQLARYVIEHLNYGYRHNSIDLVCSKSQPWSQRKVPFLSYETHEEIAFILLDACQKFQPIVENQESNNNIKGTMELVGTVMSNYYTPIADQLLKSPYLPINNHQHVHSKEGMAAEFIDWAWFVAIQLRLYDCPISPRATDIEASIDLPFIKAVLNSFNPVSSSHSALIIYIAFSLSVTSRHFLRFSSNEGWMKLWTILKRGKPEAVIQILSDIIPSFVYMHGDDFFNDESLTDLFRHLIEFKPDPMLTKAARQYLQRHKTTMNMSGIGLILGSTVWQAHLIDQTSQLMDDQGKGFSYVDLVLHSWFKTIFRKADWIWQASYISLVEQLCQLGFVVHRHRLVCQMLTEESKRLELAKQNSTSGPPRLARLMKNVMLMPDGPFASLLVGEWSVLKSNTKAPGVEQQYHWFSLYALLSETLEEASLRAEIVSAVHEECTDITTVYKTISKKPIEYFSLYRWLHHILIVPMDHPLLPLYFQMFFSLYYQLAGPHQTLGSLFFQQRPDALVELRNRIASIQTYYGQKMMTDLSTAEIQQQFYYAIWLWLGNEELSTGQLEIKELPSHYDKQRLSSCYAKEDEKEQPWHTHSFWLDLVNTHQLEQDFLLFPWQSAEKFRTTETTQGRLLTHSSSHSIQQTTSSLGDQASLSTHARRLRMLTDESTIEPLPPILIQKPT